MNRDQCAIALYANEGKKVESERAPGSVIGECIVHLLSVFPVRNYIRPRSFRLCQPFWLYTHYEHYLEKKRKKNEEKV
jgi:hypothetical protein